MHIKKLGVVAVFFVICIALLFMLRSFFKDTTETRVDFLMDTFVEQQLTGKDAVETGEAVYQALKELDKALSLYDTNSYTSKINAAAGEAYVTLPQELYALMKRSRELSAASYNAFDFTIAPVTTLWHLAKEKGIPPASGEIAKELALVDYGKVLFDDESHSIMLTEPNMAIDLGGIAKGYACDVVRKLYEGSKLKTALISIGGNVYTYRAPRGESFYRVGIKNPDENGINPLLVLNTTGEVIATSGAYERYFEYNNQIYHHIIDKKTGMPSNSDLKSVTIITSDGTLADYLSTTMFVLGKSAVLKALDEEEKLRLSGAEPEFMLLAIDNENSIYYSPTLAERLELLDKENYRFA